MPRSFLFLQGPTNWLFAEMARQLRVLGHQVHRIHFCLGDHIFWRGPGATSYRGRLEDWPAFVDAFYERQGVTDIVLLGEQRSYHKLAIELAHARGIEVAVTDFGYVRPDWVILERDGLNGNSLFTCEPAVVTERARSLPPMDHRVLYRHNPLNQALWDMAFHLSSVLWPWPYPHFQRHTLRHPLLTYLTTGWRLSRGWLERGYTARAVRRLRRAKRYYVFAMQMEDDFSLRAYSPYTDMDRPMAEVIESFALHAPASSCLLFKLHPLDPGLKAWRRRIAGLAHAAGVPDRVLFVDGGDLDALVTGSAGVLTVNSTVGLRSLQLLRPTLALGQAIYRMEGLAFGGPLDRFWTDAQAPDGQLVGAWLRLLAASLHVRGGMYDADAIRAAADGMVWRLHYQQVNQALPQVLAGQSLRIPDAAG